MNSCFPTLLPDELLWSAVARWAELFLGRKTGALSYELCGYVYLRIAAFLPSDLSAISARLPHKPGSSANELIRNHTMYPLIAPFVGQRRRERGQNAMLECTRGRRATDSWLRPMGLSVRSPLRYCCLCAVEQKQSFGFSYWRRIHQIPILRICADHKCLLTDTNVIPSKEKLVALDAIRPTARCPITCPDSIQLQIAEDMTYLLNKNRNEPGHDKMRSAVEGRMNATLSGRSVRKCFKEIRRELGSRLTNSPELASVVASFPLLNVLSLRDMIADGQSYSLLARTFGTSLRTLMDEACLATDDEPPWPCMNPNCACFKKPVIRNCRRDGRNSSLIFRCPTCDEAYGRSLPLQRKANGDFAIFYLRDSLVWAQQLPQYWTNPALTWSDICLIFQKSHDTVARAACYFCLPDMPNRSLARFRPKMAASLVLTRARDRIEKRAIWSRAIEACSRRPFNMFPPHVRRVRRWLLLNDRDWLLVNGFKCPPIGSAIARRKHKAAKMDARRHLAESNFAGLSPEQIIRQTNQSGRVSVNQLVSILSKNTGIPETSLRRIESIRAHLKAVAETVEQHFHRLLAVALANPLVANEGYSRFVRKLCIQIHVCKDPRLDKEARAVFGRLRESNVRLQSTAHAA